MHVLRVTQCDEAAIREYLEIYLYESHILEITNPA